jgi:hypothetical protein
MADDPEDKGVGDPPSTGRRRVKKSSKHRSSGTVPLPFPPPSEGKDADDDQPPPPPPDEEPPTPVAGAGGSSGRRLVRRARPVPAPAANDEGGEPLPPPPDAPPPSAAPRRVRRLPPVGDTSGPPMSPPTVAPAPIDLDGGWPEGGGGRSPVRQRGPALPPVCLWVALWYRWVAGVTVCMRAYVCGGGGEGGINLTFWLTSAGCVGWSKVGRTPLPTPRGHAV